MSARVCFEGEEGGENRKSVVKLGMECLLSLAVADGVTRHGDVEPYGADGRGDDGDGGDDDDDGGGGDDGDDYDGDDDDDDDDDGGGGDDDDGSGGGGGDGY